jgi:hypothetical protein
VRDAEEEDVLVWIASFLAMVAALRVQQLDKSLQQQRAEAVLQAFVELVGKGASAALPSELELALQADVKWAQ